MNEENIFQIMLQAMLDKIKSIANIKVNIKAIETKLPKIKLQGTLLKTATQKEVNSKLKSIRPKINVDADITQAEKKIKKIGKQKTKTTVTATVDNSQVVSGLQQAQKEIKTLWERFTSGIIGINLVRMSVQRVTQAIREAIAAVKELDTTKTNIQMVSGTSDSDVNAMMSSYNAMAKDLSSTTKDVAEAANEFLRMGESIASTNELIKSSQVLSKVGMIESSEAASYLISSLKGYQIAAEDSMDIVSKLTSVDLEAAVSAGGLAEALSKCANIASNSGVAMDRLIGYTATVGETTQKSMSEVGNSFQALLSRMNNIKIGRFIDDETGESLSDTEAVLNKLGIQLRDTENTYRSFDDVLDDVGNRWKDFTKVEQNAISVAIAGTRQRENFESLMNNWGNALKYSETAANSAGSALERYGVYQDSIQAKTNELTAAIESLSTSTISEGLYSGIIEATTGIVEFLDKTNLLKASLAGLIAMGASKAIASMGAGFITAAKSTAQLSAAMALFDNGRSVANLKAIGKACIGLNDSQLKLVLSTKGLTTVQKLSILEGMGLEEQERKQMLTTLGFAAAEDKATVSTFSLKGAFNALKTAIAMNPIGAVVTAVSVATMVFSSFNRAMEEARQKAKELGNSFKDTSSDIESYKTQIEELYKTINNSNSSIEDVTNARQTLMSVQDELIDKFGTEKNVINDVTEAINGQTEALDRLTNAKWQETKNNFNNGGFWNNMGNWLQGYDTNIDRMVAEMENVREILSFSYNDIDSKDFSALKQLLKERGWSYQNTLGGFVKEGNLKEIYSEILEIQTLAGDIEAPDYFLKDLTKDANAAKESLDNYSEMWDAYILNDRVFANEDLADSWHKVNEAYSDYQEAFTSGNQVEIDKTLSNYADLMSKVLNNSDIDESIKDYFENMYPALQTEVEKWEFHAKILPEYDIHALSGKTKADILGTLQTDEMQDGEQTFNSILSLASKYGIVTGNNTEKINKLLDLLVEWGILQDSINESTAEYAVGTTSSLSISQTVDQLNTQLKPAMDSIKSAWQDIFAEDGFALNSIDILSTCDSIKSKLDELNEIEGITVDYSAFEDFVRVLNNTESTESDVEQAFDSLATSITQAAISGAEDFATMKAALEDLGVINNELVAFDALISNTEALKEAGLDLANATDVQIAAFANEIVSTENVSQAIAMLTFQKELYALQDMNTAGEVANLLTLAENAGYTGEVIEHLTELEQIYQQVASGTLTPGQLDAKLARAAELEKAIKESASNIKYEPKIDFSGATKSAKSAGKEAGKSYKDALKEELNDLDSVISGITGRIDDQIGSINSQKSAALDAIDAEKEALESAKDAAVEALENERQKRLDVIEAQRKQIEQNIKAKQKVIDGINAEIKAMQDANKQRRLQNDLMKAQYELERLQQQRVILQYSEDKGMHYVTNTKDIRSQKQAVEDAKLEIEIANKEKQIDLIEQEIDKLNEALDLLDEQENQVNDHYDKLISETEKFYDQQLRALEKQRKETEAYFESLSKNLENQKSKFQELTEILEKAELSAKLKQLGIDEEALLNGSEEEFNKLKDAYMNIVTQLNSGNDEVLASLQELSGYEGAAPTVLSDTAEKLGEMNTQLKGSTESMDKLSVSATTASEGTSAIATNMGELNTSTEGLSDNLTGISNAINGISTDSAGNITTLAEAFTALGEAITSVAEALGIGEEVAASGIVDALTSISEISLGADEEGIIGQFNQLKTAVEGVTSAISGGGSEEGGSDKGASNSSSPSMSEGSKEGSSGGLSGAITEMGNTATETLGEAGGEDGEGEGEGVISKFNMLKTAVDNVTTAIGVGGEEGEGSEENANTLIGALQAQYEKATEVLPETKSLFEELLSVIESCVGALNSMVSAMTSMQNISMPSMGGSVSVGYNGTVGKAFADGTTGFKNLPTTGYKGLPHDEKNTLRSEYGQPELTVYPNGEAEVTTQPTMSDLPKGTVIFNEEQTKKIMNGDGKAKAVGKAYANGTTRPKFSYETFLDYFYNPPVVQAPDPSTFDPFNDPTLRGIELFEELTSQGSTLKSIETHTQEISRNVSTINTKNIQPSYTIGDINVTCPGVTSQAVMNELGAALDSKFSGLHLDAYQRANMR